VDDHRHIPVCLSIAGSDSGGGAGIQADLKAFAACGVHGTTAITAVTAQNTQAVTRVEAISPDMIVAQVAAVVDDIGVDAVKVGMLGNVETIEAVARALDLVPPRTPVVVDPVMVAESGARLLEEQATSALIRLILPRATVATPNVPEARVLAGAEREEDSVALARAVHRLGPAAVVVTGGHRAAAIDVFHDGAETVEIPGERHPGGAAHGSGCTHSSALAAHLALGWTPLEAARAAKEIAAAAVRDGLSGIGMGAGPVDALAIGSKSTKSRPR
jgi:hydroxymethylpyrimidine/phosphomethylpyrimidine kinase